MPPVLGSSALDRCGAAEGRADRETSVAVTHFCVGWPWAGARLLAESQLPAHHRAIKNQMGERCHERVFTP
jgi:hypothetical protein